MYYDLIYNEFNETIKMMKIFTSEKRNIHAIELSAKLMANTFKAKGKVLSCGNGGSHCSAMHFAEELTGRYRNDRVGYAAIAISDPSYLSCVSNDFGYKYVFSRYIESVGNEKDVLFAISTSGKSINILSAIEAAYKKKMKVIFLTGTKKENKLSDFIDVEICVPCLSFLDYIQEIHIKIIHLLVFIIEKEMQCLSSVMNN